MSLPKFVKVTLAVWSVCFVLGILPAAAQQQANLNRYWSYRERLRSQWIVISSHVEEFGVNLPASDKEYDEVIWGDANNMMGHYLTMLSTELWLLKSNEQNYSKTLQELFYAMHAMERLDAYAESNHRPPLIPLGGGTPIPLIYESDRNGMQLRDDVTEGFWTTNHSVFGVTNYGSNYKGFLPDGHLPYKEISQDVMYHNIEGLLMVSKLVGTESVAGIPITFRNATWTPNYLVTQGIQSGNNVNFSLWAQDIVRRYIDWFQYASSPKWQLLNMATGNKVQEGDGYPDAGYWHNMGLIAAGIKITGEDLRRSDRQPYPPASADRRFIDIFRDGTLNDIFGIDFNVNQDVDRLVRSLAASSNYMETTTVEIQRERRDDPNNKDFEHHPLISYTLYDNSSEPMEPGNSLYDYERSVIEGKLNAAPNSGPNGSDPIWRGSSRLIWPESVENNSRPTAVYSGLDYMVEHNLYYTAFRKEDFKDLVIPSYSIIPFQYIIGDYYRRRIETSKEISTSFACSYNGHKGVVLKPGFHAPTGSTFRATVNGRPGNYDGSLYKDPNGPIRLASDVVYDANPWNEVYNSQFYEGPAPDINPVQQVTVVAPRATERAYSVFPNPAKETFNLIGPSEAPDNSYMELLTVQGQVLRKEKITGGLQSVNVSELADGTYILKVYAGDEVTVKKVTVIN